MYWKRYGYWLSGLSFVLTTIALIAIDSQEGPIDPTSWESICTVFSLAVPMVFVGLNIVMSPDVLLDWLSSRLHWHPPTYSFRVFGCCLVLGGVMGLGLGILNTLVALGTVPNPYTP